MEESKHKANPATIFTFLEVTYAGVPGLIHGNFNIVQGNRYGFKTVVTTEALLLLSIRTTRGM
jgi:hypothetical protein